MAIFILCVTVLLKLYIFLLSIRITSTWFLNINWYSQPFLTLSYLTDPFLSLCRGTLPVLFGIDFSTILCFFILQFGLQILENLEF